MIIYKTYDEQVEILKSRGMIISDINFAKEILKQNNYYNLVNGFKDLFIQQDTVTEQYIHGVTFEELYSLYQFDKSLRLALSRMLIVAERTTASIIAHEFSKNYPNHDNDYLDPNNYDTTGKKAISVSKLITGERGLTETLKHADNKKNSMICHYIKKYNRVPLWVFINLLSFGTLSKMYSLFKSRERDAIAKSISQISGLKLFPDNIQNALYVLVLLRNNCAHDQKIFDFSSHPTLIKPNDFYKQYFPLSKGSHTLFGAISCMSFFLRQKEFNSYIKDLREKIKTLFTKIHSIPTIEILNKMGITQSFLS